MTDFSVLMVFMCIDTEKDRFFNDDQQSKGCKDFISDGPGQKDGPLAA